MSQDLTQKFAQDAAQGLDLGDQYKGADLSGVGLDPGTSLQNAFLRYTRFRGAQLRGVDFRGANLRHADFQGADLRDARFDGADVGRAHFEGANVGGNSLVRAKNLEQAHGIKSGVLFFTQQLVEQMLVDGEVDEPSLNDQKLLLSNGQCFAMQEAFRVVSVIDGDDQEQLVGRVMTEQQLRDTGGEFYPDALVLGDSGYELLQGYLAYRDANATATAQRNEQPTPKPAAQKTEEPAVETKKPSDKSSDIELLNDFLLGQLGSE